MHQQMAKFISQAKLYFPQPELFLNEMIASSFSITRSESTEVQPWTQVPGPRARGPPLTTTNQHSELRRTCVFGPNNVLGAARGGR